MNYIDLKPDIYRQRLVVEGIPQDNINSEEIKNYLKELGGVCDMSVLMEPITHESSKFGWSGWVHWETSGAHLYAWNKPELFYSVDIYTCKSFSVQKAVEFTKKFFNSEQITYKEF